jgi:hypothetical protein
MMLEFSTIKQVKMNLLDLITATHRGERIE